MNVRSHNPNARMLEMVFQKLVALIERLTAQTDPEMQERAWKLSVLFELLRESMKDLNDSATSGLYVREIKSLLGYMRTNSSIVRETAAIHQLVRLIEKYHLQSPASSEVNDFHIQLDEREGR